MIKNKTILIFSLISLTILSCNQGNIKEKELELKERELALKEKEFASTQTVAPVTENKIRQQPNNNLEEFLGCWYWGNKQDGDFAILEIKPNNLLVIHRLDLSPGEEINHNAEYKISGGKIIFLENSILLENEFHIENIQGQVNLVEENSDNPNKFLKVNCK